MIATGIGVGLVNVSMSVYKQLNSVDEFKGRYFGIESTFPQIFSPIATIATGYILSITIKMYAISFVSIFGFLLLGYFLEKLFLNKFLKN